ncbi:helix-turn-helix domain-containing protein [Hymenobacter sp. H14-R3]|uniref:winged helix-turn-helix transcriptional regulator n=1 Tax=Hymenobacter sp. H14-R3 TaxID=3046308 RepID=UPI0024BBDCD6|nr:helix-turn-helix domain-containing protein [Hymenobacter sp. H14-R3]MDJ0367808.1 helix-turn-helix domain-containing protein [Hymenobacter sp. H14-R3]
MDPMNPSEEKSLLARQKLQAWLEAKPNLDETCVVHQALSLLASKWLLLILLALMQRPKRNSALQRQIRGVSPKMLSQSLRQLETRGLVHRRVFAEVPPHVEYSLTPFGESVAPLLVELCEWSVRWEAQVQQIRPLV